MRGDGLLAWLRGRGGDARRRRGMSRAKEDPHTCKAGGGRRVAKCSLLSLLFVAPQFLGAGNFVSLLVPNAFFVRSGVDLSFFAVLALLGHHRRRREINTRQHSERSGVSPFGAIS